MSSDTVQCAVFLKTGVLDLSLGEDSSIGHTFSKLFEIYQIHLNLVHVFETYLNIYSLISHLFGHYRRLLF